MTYNKYFEWSVSDTSKSQHSFESSSRQSFQSRIEAALSSVVLQDFSYDSHFLMTRLKKHCLLRFITSIIQTAQCAKSVLSLGTPHSNVCSGFLQHPNLSKAASYLHKQENKRDVIENIYWDNLETRSPFVIQFP